MPADLTDVRVMIPRVRRAVEGPVPTVGSARLSDDQVTAMVADAVADVILYSGNLFGHQLIVATRDVDTGWPLTWTTEVPLDEWEVTLITTQAALTYFFHAFKDMKVSEEIQNEGQRWAWEKSPNLLVAQIKGLQEQRDLAIANLRKMHPVLDRYASILRVRDRATAAMVEWYTSLNPGEVGNIGGLGGGQEASVVPYSSGALYPEGSL